MQKAHWGRGRLVNENPNKVDQLPINTDSIELYSGHLGEVSASNDDRIMVRANTFQEKGKGIFAPRNQEEDKKTAIEFATEGNHLLHELSDDYHIRVPETQLLVGKDTNDKMAVFCLTRHVTGETVSRFLSHPSIFAELSNTDRELFVAEADDLISGLLNYYFDKLDSNGNYLWDIYGLGQYMFGKQKGDDINHIYLIDTDPAWKEATEALGVTLEDIDIIISNFKSLERVTSLPLTKSRQQLTGLVSRAKPIFKKIVASGEMTDVGCNFYLGEYRKIQDEVGK